MRKPVAISVIHAGRRLDSETTLARLGPYTVELASVVSGVDVELHSVYLGHPGIDTHAVHLELRRGGAARAVAHQHSHAALPVIYAHERLMLDHAARLRDLVADVGGQHTAVEFGDVAVDAEQG